MNQSPTSSPKKQATGTGSGPPAVPQRDLEPFRDCVSYVRDYVRQKPDVAALWCFGIGFVVGWKIKPW